ncbi:hypothetical protein B5X24_HaOG209563 [Helicoverpa armigera]|uniref:AB hydrolase-1 domain-containing protein n=1 Tax=Helicoverpa armigera TaxID=29058 RepID=A0A2W1BKM5_HELAM|nr:hypothetical protein B5X24_HaOG209563 [Helicoverpa armigera]
MYIFEIKKELLVGFSLSILYITYYLVEVVKKPILICREGEFRQFLEENVPLLSEHYWPTPWCVESRLQTVLGSVLRSRLLPPVKYRRQVVRLSDGGQVALDWVESAGPARAVLLVLPGLTGCADADYHGAGAGVHAALAVSSPLDVVKGSECMERAPLNALLSYHMARNLRRTLRAHEPLRAGPCDWRGVERARSVREFDAAFTTKHFGFGSVDAYYAAASLRDKLAAVRVPLLCLCAADDPFQPLGAMPLEEAREAERVALLVTARGGHIGFLEGWWPARAARDQYIARLATQYFAALLARADLLHAAPDC